MAKLGIKIRFSGFVETMCKIIDVRSTMSSQCFKLTAAWKHAAVYVDDFS
jgi:hypothetical protein